MLYESAVKSLAILKTVKLSLFVYEFIAALLTES